MKIAGVLLMLVGVAALAYGGFTYTTHKRAVDMGPVQIERSKHHYAPVPPLLGMAILAGGGVLLVIGAKQGR